MSDQPSAAFLSYVHSDDDHDRGRITQLRERLEGEVKMHTGLPFRIFQDRNDLEWGQHWESRISDTLDATTFLIPVITPSFFKSPACRSEFSIFQKRESVLGSSRLILPIYYLNCDEIEEVSADEIAGVLKARQWSDWRGLRFHELSSPEVSSHLASQAAMIKSAVREMSSLLNKAPSSVFDELIEQRHSSEVSVPTVIEDGSLVPAEKKKRKSYRSGGSEGFPPIDSEKFSYKIYTSEYDEVISADKLLSPEEIIDYGKKVLDISQLIEKRFSKELLDKYNSLAEVVDDDTAIFILVDNSGSMRGEPIMQTAAWCAVLLGLFSSLRVATALTGFTTRSWKGGRSREKWLEDGRPAFPGRLADLRYVTYKGFGDPLMQSQYMLGGMLKDGMLKENVDGEALQWAIGEIRKTEKNNKIILVLSDGAPVDDSTLSVNPSNFLDLHLKQVIEENDLRDVGLAAVGINFDVSRYYETSSTSTLDNIGLLAIDMIIESALRASA
jgi:cobaltochelatase CobT